jgi:hypothetical protein
MDGSRKASGAGMVFMILAAAVVRSFMPEGPARDRPAGSDGEARPNDHPG